MAARNNQIALSLDGVQYLVLLFGFALNFFLNFFGSSFCFANTVKQVLTIILSQHDPPLNSQVWTHEWPFM